MTLIKDLDINEIEDPLPENILLKPYCKTKEKRKELALQYTQCIYIIKDDLMQHVSLKPITNFSLKKLMSTKLPSIFPSAWNYKYYKAKNFQEYICAIIEIIVEQCTEIFSNCFTDVEFMR